MFRLGCSGHQAYEPGTEGFKAVVTEFGEDLVSESGDIDRKKLGAIVFSDKVSQSRGIVQNHKGRERERERESGWLVGKREKMGLRGWGGGGVENGVLWWGRDSE